MTHFPFILFLLVEWTHLHKWMERPIWSHSWGVHVGATWFQIGLGSSSISHIGLVSLDLRHIGLVSLGVSHVGLSGDMDCHAAWGCHTVLRNSVQMPFRFVLQMKCFGRFGDFGEIFRKFIYIYILK